MNVIAFPAHHLAPHCERSTGPSRSFGSLFVVGEGKDYTRDTLWVSGKLP